MESLARLAAIIFLTIILLGLISFVVLRRPPRNLVLRVLFGLIAAFGIYSGAWLALLQIDLVGRLIGAAVAVASGKALLAVMRRPSARE